jgi:hypothetical protein
MTSPDAIDRVIADVKADGVKLSRPQVVRALDLMQCTAAEYLACRQDERETDVQIDRLLAALEQGGAFPSRHFYATGE